MVASKNIAVKIIATIFIFLFTYTSVSKAIRIDYFKMTLAQSSMISNWSPFLAWLIVAAEWAAVILLVIPPSRLYGLALSLALMAIFTIYIFIMLLFSSHLPCSCGGILKQLTWKNHLYLNMFLTALAAVGFIKEGRRERHAAFYT